MKRHGNLWPTLTSFPHLLKAAQKAKRGKRFRPAVASFEEAASHHHSLRIFS